MYGIIPDLCTYGKVIGGGMPVGAFGGRKDIMDMLAPLGPVYQAGTLSGNPTALACGLATLEYLEANSGWLALEKATSLFVEKLRTATAGLPVNIGWVGSIFWINLQKNSVSRAEEIDPNSGSLYMNIFNQALEAGIYLAPSVYEVGFISTVHSPEILDSATEILAEILKSGQK